MEDFETFYSKPLDIKVKELPNHPLKENVSVGNFKLREKINTNNLTTGEDLNYEFEILGEGNISAISEPIINLDGIDFYPQILNKISEEKKVRFMDLKSLIFMGYHQSQEIMTYQKTSVGFFNPNKSKYDTLKSDINLKVTGKTLYKNITESEDLNPLLNLIEEEDTH